MKHVKKLDPNIMPKGELTYTRYSQQRQAINDLVEAVQEIQTYLNPLINVNGTYEKLLDTKEKRYTVAELREKLERYQQYCQASRPRGVSIMGYTDDSFLDWLESNHD